MSNVYLSQTAFSRLARIAAIITGLAAIPVSHATLLVYEGFNGYTAGTLKDQKPNDNTVGLDKTVGYYDGATASRAGGYTLEAASLAFDGLQTTGGSLKFGTGTNVIGADLAVNHEGTLWSSYLVNLSFRGGASGDGATIRIGAAPNDSSTANHFNSWADSRAGTSGKVAAGYGSTGTDGEVGLTLNTTYLIINRFTNVGTPGGGTATLWALTEEQFESLITHPDGITESALQATSVTATAENISGTAFVFSSAQAFGIVTVGDAGVYDELRFATALTDVIPTTIPEPATTALVAGLGCGLLFVARRRPCGSADRG